MGSLLMVLAITVIVKFLKNLRIRIYSKDCGRFRKMTRVPRSRIKLQRRVIPSIGLEVRAVMIKKVTKACFFY